MTTRLLLLPDEQTLLWLESNLPADALVEAIRRGRWFPPEPYADRKPAQCTLLFDNLVITTLAPAVPPAEPEQADPSISHRHSAPAIPTLSERQRQVLSLLAEGLTPKEISLQLGLSLRQVRRHLKNLRERFGSNTLAQSLGKAISLGLLDDL